LSSSTIYAIILLPSLFFLHTPAQAQDPIVQQCSNSAYYTSNTPFETNLNLLLPSLASNGSRDGFFNTSIGIAPDTVYGLVSCRGDISMENCQICLNTSTVQVLQTCPKRKEAVLWYNHCILHYSSNRFFSQVDINARDIADLAKVSEAAANDFNQQLSNLMNNLSHTAASRPSKFYSGTTDYKPFSELQILVQCTRDLSATDCLSCLQSMIRFIPDCCARSVGAQICSTTCNLVFHVYPFLESPPLYDASGVETSPAQSNIGTGKRKSSIKVVVIVVPTIGSLLVLLAIFAYLRRNKRKRNPNTSCEDDLKTEETLQYDLNTIRTATNDFSDANKLGEGGFGAVYKGEFLDGTEIAVKRLSKNSGQGSQEFKNEVVLLHKLQHRNLVRLLGFCLEGEEKLLIYEYLSNKSLDKYLFDPTKKARLNWERRCKIISGIARGLLYLHEDSRLRIIHRDLKAGNILLDDEMNAKIADFGMAKLFGGDQSQGNTRRIAGTLGYMAPEYAIHGVFSVKSDVFSFGVLLLEIVSGKKSNDFYLSGPSRNLLNYAWKLWREEGALEFIDPILIDDSFSANEAMRCIQMGLLCVQNNFEDRPTMSSVVLMLNSSLPLKSPLAPAFSSITQTGATDASRSSVSNNSANSSLLDSVNGITIPR
ncbi:hypothetical protein AQUCO_00500441v1, partial [Aquilegia coerulea]